MQTSCKPCATSCQPCVNLVPPRTNLVPPHANLVPPHANLVSPHANLMLTSCKPHVVLGYHWLPLATIDLVGDNREFEV